jgi:TRAP-type C4-dicarboxylate transport system permease small subunit
MLKSMRPWLNGLHRFEDAALMLALLSMLVLAVSQIVLRNVFDSGFLWAESFLRILVLWVAMLGAMVATRENNHINIDAVSRYVPAKTKSGLLFITRIFSAVVCGAVAWYAIDLVQIEYEDQTIAFAQVPTWICQSILPFGFSVMSIRFALNVIKDLLPRQ